MLVGLASGDQSNQAGLISLHSKFGGICCSSVCKSAFGSEYGTPKQYISLGLQAWRETVSALSVAQLDFGLHRQLRITERVGLRTLRPKLPCCQAGAAVNAALLKILPP